jgi:hypothetical protein
MIFQAEMTDAACLPYQMSWEHTPTIFLRGGIFITPGVGVIYNIYMHRSSIPLFLARLVHASLDTKEGKVINHVQRGEGLVMIEIGPHLKDPDTEKKNLVSLESIRLDHSLNQAGMPRARTCLVQDSNLRARRQLKTCWSLRSREGIDKRAPMSNMCITYTSNCDK